MYWQDTSRLGSFKTKPETIRYHKVYPKGILSIYVVSLIMLREFISTNARPEIRYQYHQAHLALEIENIPGFSVAGLSDS